MASDLNLTSAIAAAVYADEPQLCTDPKAKIRPIPRTDLVAPVAAGLRWTLEDHGFCAKAPILTTRGWVTASEVVLDDSVVTSLGLVRITGVARRKADLAIVISNGTDALHVAPGQLLSCSHWVCKALIDLETALVPAAALERGVGVVMPSGGLDLVSLTLDCSCVIEVRGFHLAVPRAEAFAGRDWHNLRAPASIAPGMHLADPASCSQLDQAGIVLRSRSNRRTKGTPE